MTTDVSPTLPQDVIALVPMRNVVLFPHVLMPLTVGRPKSLAALQFAWLSDVDDAIHATLGVSSALRERPRFELM